MRATAIEIQNLSKRYRIGGRHYGTLRSTLANLWQKKERTDFWALNQVSVQLEEGSSTGIIGRNGAGKSTMLKILSKITYPTTGYAKLHGRVASLLEVGTGFHPELTGRENIYLNGSLLGMNKAEIKKKFDEIVDFSGVEPFIDTPVKHFSSGMFVRLAFAVAAHLDTEILLVDEVLAVGDYEFQQKCLAKLNSTTGKKTVLFVSHDLAIIEQLCEQTIWLENGKVRSFGNSATVIEGYKDIGSHAPSNVVSGNKKAYVVLKSKDNARTHQPYTLDFKIENTTSEKIENIRLDIGIDDNFGNRVGWLTNTNERFDLSAHDSVAVSFAISNCVYKTGRYSLTSYLENDRGLIEYNQNLDSFYVQSEKADVFILPPDGQGSVFLNYKIDYSH